MNLQQIGSSQSHREEAASLSLKQSSNKGISTGFGYSVNLTSHFCSQGPPGDIGFKGIQGPRGPPGLMVSAFPVCVFEKILFLLPCFCEAAGAVRSTVLKAMAPPQPLSCR